MTDLTRLNSEGLKRFVEEDLDEFIRYTKDIREDAPAQGPRALKSLIEGYTTPDTQGLPNQFLRIGKLGNDDGVHGAELTKRIESGAKGIDDVLVTMGSLFKHIDADLRETIETLLKTQGDSLAAIGGQKLLDIFSDVDSDLSGSPASSGDSKK